MTLRESIRIEQEAFEDWFVKKVGSKERLRLSTLIPNWYVETEVRVMYEAFVAGLHFGSKETV